MVKQELQDKEKVVYSILNNSFKNNRIAHLYLLNGENLSLIKQTAFLIAQSIIEENNDFACETCNTCRRILNNEHLDCIYIDGDSSTIKKDEIEELFDRFKMKASESNSKVFIINNINNASNKVYNMLLKFIEEPRDNTYGILITSDINSLLDTIVSRSLILNFKSKVDNTKLYLDKGFDELDAYLLNKLFKEYKDIDLNDEAFINSKDILFKSIDTLSDPYSLLNLFISELYILDKTSYFKNLCVYYLNLFIIIIKDSINNPRKDLSHYIELINQYGRDDLYNILIDTKKELSTNIDYKLIFDKMAYKILSK